MLRFRQPFAKVGLQVLVCCTAEDNPANGRQGVSQEEMGEARQPPASLCFAGPALFLLDLPSACNAHLYPSRRSPLALVSTYMVKREGSRIKLSSSRHY